MPQRIRTLELPILSRLPEVQDDKSPSRPLQPTAVGTAGTGRFHPSGAPSQPGISTSRTRSRSNRTAGDSRCRSLGGVTDSSYGRPSRTTGLDAKLTTWPQSSAH